MAIKRYNSTEVHLSRYVQGGSTERYPTRLGWWERNVMPKSDSDIKIVINTRYHQRPWLVAADVYGLDDFEWVVLQYNCILDVMEEFVIGRTIVLPTAKRLQLEVLANSIGGISMVE